MARKKISELDDGGLFQAGDSILIARDGANYRVNGAQIANTVANVANMATSITSVSDRVSALEGVTSAVVPHRYWRLVILSAQSSTSGTTIAELKFMAAVGGPNLAVGGTPLSSGDYNATNTKDKAFDGNATTVWESSAQTTTTFANGAAWIGYDFGSPKVIGAVSVSCSTYFQGGRPSRGRVEYSDDGSTWVTAWSWGPLVAWPSGVAATRTIVAPDPRIKLIPGPTPTALTFPIAVNGTDANTAIYADAAVYSIWRTDGGNTSNSSAHRVAGRVKTLTSTNWSAQMVFRVPSVGVWGKTFRVGMMVRNSTSGKLAVLNWSFAVNQTPTIFCTRYNDTETADTSIILFGEVRHTENMTFRADHDGQSLYMYSSNNFGRTWFTIGAATLGFVADQVGPAMVTVGGQAAPAVAMDVLSYSDIEL